MPAVFYGRMAELYMDLRPEWGTSLLQEGLLYQYVL
jgi:hypothetical protein